MAGFQAVLEDLVQRVLDAGQGFGRIIILVMDVDVVAGHRFPDIAGQQALVHVTLGRLGSEFHHHARRGVRVHVGILAGDVIGLRVDDGLEDLVGLGLAGQVALVAVGDVLLGDFLARALHELELDAVLDILDAHFVAVHLGDGIGNLGGQDDVLSAVGYIHRLKDGGNDFLVVEVDDATVALDDVLDHDRR